MSAPRVLLVVPCFNEERRLAAHAYRAFAARHPDVGFLFVDDGSQDGTAKVLDAMCGELGGGSEVLRLARNSGKAEAVRLGILHALERSPEHVGYWDADLATPLDELPNLMAALDAHPDAVLASGARVRLLGTAIERLPARHYLGRLFATAASLLLRAPVYDTQCGAKLFRTRAGIRELFREPFSTDWLFDLEILARLKRLGGTPTDLGRVVREVPLRSWQDVAGSKLRARDYLRVGPDLLRIYLRYLRFEPSEDGVDEGRQDRSLREGYEHAEQHHDHDDGQQPPLLAHPHERPQLPHE